MSFVERDPDASMSDADMAASVLQATPEAPRTARGVTREAGRGSGRWALRPSVPSTRRKNIYDAVAGEFSRGGHGTK